MVGDVQEEGPKTDGLEAKGERSPKCIYLDQNIFGHMLDEGRGAWRDSEWGRVITEAEERDGGQVWIGPTHAIETLLASDASRRMDLARVMLEVAGYRRMWHGYEVELLVEFMEFLKGICPNAFRTDFFLKLIQEEVAKTWLAVLTLLASGGPPNAASVDKVARIKKTNQVLHARLAANPNNWVDRMIEASKQWLTTRSEVLQELDDKGLEELDAEIAALTGTAEKLSKKHFDRLNKERQTIASAYGAIEIGAILGWQFRWPMSLELTLDLPAIVEEWKQAQARHSLRSMPQGVRDGITNERAVDEQVQISVVETVIRAWAEKGPLTARASYECLILELQRRLNDKKLPTPGIVFDADHAGVLRRVNIFGTADRLFGENVKKVAEEIHKATKGGHRPAVVCTPAELAKELRE